MSKLIYRKTVFYITIILSSIFLTQNIVFAVNLNFIHAQENKSFLSPQITININIFKSGFKTISANFSNQQYAHANPQELFELYEKAHYLKPAYQLSSKGEKDKYKTQKGNIEKGKYFEQLFFKLREEFIKREKSFEIVLNNFTEKKFITLSGMRLLKNINIYNVKEPIHQILPRILPDGTVIWSEQLFGNKKIDNEFKLFCYVYTVNILFFHTKSQSMGRTLLYFQRLNSNQKK
ncbi:MAG: hypothetical protein ABIG64_06130 [Candidatus Omnitrophota bacterium]